jgi:hypothetical protein
VHMGSSDINNDYSHGVVLLNNTFKNLCDIGSNHTDNIQFDADANQVRLAGNYIYEAQNCPTQGITDYDGNVTGTVIIENNVVDVPRDWGIEIYANKSTSSLTIKHNTVVYHPKSYSEFNNGTGNIDLGLKSGQTCGGAAATIVRDNVGFLSGSCSATADHNTDPSTVTYVNPVAGSSHDNYLLAAASPGHLAASDGTDTGIFANGTVNPPPPPPPPSDTTPPTVSMTAPTAGATVSGASVALSANASDNVGVVGVQFKVDGSSVGSEDTTSPYSITWDSRTVTNGSHTITAVARDAAGNSTTSSTVTVTTNNTSTCSTSTATFTNSSFASQSGSFTFSYDATPSATGIDSVTGLSNGAAAAFTDLATAVRFNTTGTIDARNAGAYAAVNTLNYSAGTSYHFSMSVNVSAHTYSVTVTPAGGSATTIATNYAFRTEQASVASLSNWATNSTTGSQSICAATVTTGGTTKIGDLNNDGSVNIFDLSILLSKYNTSTASADLNNDGIVNVFDLSILLSHYGT